MSTIRRPSEMNTTEQISGYRITYGDSTEVERRFWDGLRGYCVQLQCCNDPCRDVEVKGGTAYGVLLRDWTDDAGEGVGPQYLAEYDTITAVHIY